MTYDDLFMICDTHLDWLAEAGNREAVNLVNFVKMKVQHIVLKAIKTTEHGTRLQRR